MPNNITINMNGSALINGQPIQFPSGGRSITPSSDMYIDTIQTAAVNATTAPAFAKGGLSTISYAIIKNNADPVANPTYSIQVLNQATVSGATILATIGPGECFPMTLNAVANIYLQAVAGTPEVQYKLFTG